MAILPWWQSAHYWVAMLLGPLSWVCMWSMDIPLRQSDFVLRTFLIVALVYPVLEEIVFRGGLQEFLLKQKAFKSSRLGISVANVATSVAFAAVHLFTQPPLWAALIFIPSLVFGWVRDRFGSVLPSIGLHVFYNAGFLWLFGNM